MFVASSVRTMVKSAYRESQTTLCGSCTSETIEIPKPGTTEKPISPVGFWSPLQVWVSSAVLRITQNRTLWQRSNSDPVRRSFGAYLANCDQIKTERPWFPDHQKFVSS